MEEIKGQLGSGGEVGGEKRLPSCNVPTESGVLPALPLTGEATRLGFVAVKTGSVS